MLQCLTQTSRLRMETVEWKGEEESKTEAQEKSIVTSYVLLHFFLLLHIRYIFFPPFCLATYSSHTLLFYSFLIVLSVPHLIPFNSFQFLSLLILLTTSFIPSSFFLYFFLNYVYPVFYLYLIPLLVHLISVDFFHYILPSFFFF